MKKIAFVIVAVILLSAAAVAAPSNNLVYSSSGQQATFIMPREELDSNYNNSALKYYTFSVSGLTVRADKNCFYDFDLKSVEYKLGHNSFVVVFRYNDGSEKTLDTARLDLRYTVTGDNVTEFTVPVFSGKKLTCDKTNAGEIVFTTKNIGAFTLENYEFSDVNDPAIWYYKYVNKCAALGILSGMGDGSFMPDKTVTRAELAVMIVKSTSHFISYRIDENISFTDVKKGKWYYDYVMKCASVGIIFGKGDGIFAPDAYATREEIAALTARVIKIAGSYNSQSLPVIESTDELTTLYPDSASIAKYAKSDVLLCNKLGIMVGDQNGFRPKASTTRAECARIFCDLKNNILK